MDLEKIKKHDIKRDRVILSKGHGTAGLYAVMYHNGLLDKSLIDTYFKDNTILAGHTSHHVPFVEHSTGALGHGFSVGLGIAIGMKSKKIEITSQVKFLENKVGEHQSFFIKDPNDFTVEFKCFTNQKEVFKS